MITLPEGDEKRTSEEVSCQLAKEIKLQHRAPVLHIAVVDGRDFALGHHPPIGEMTPTPATYEGGHRAILCSEEQLKSFHLPTLKPGRHKYKLTAMEGGRIRKVQMVNLRSKTGTLSSFYFSFHICGKARCRSLHSFVIICMVQSNFPKPE